MPTTNTHPADLPDTLKPVAQRPPNVNDRRPAVVAAEPPTLATVLADAHPKLCKPFAQALIELKPGATTKDKSRAMAVPYVDMRAYQTRLDRVVGPEGWSVRYRRLSDRAVVCHLTILGHTREDVGECDAGDENQATSAVAQAFKRACAAFGLGRYLYTLPQVWAEWDDQKKLFPKAGEIVAQMYATLKADE